MRKASLLIAIIFLCWLAAPVTTIAGITTYSYDHSGRLIDVDNPDASYIHLSYDAAGNIVRIRKADNNETIPGDLNSDGTVTLMDAMLSLQVSSGIAPEDITPRGDIGSNGQIGVEETIYILRTVAE